jgi:TP901 family phage tail tape measure protein
MSIAQLGYQIDSSQAVAAERNLDGMATSADKAGAGADRLQTKSAALGATIRRVAALAGSLGAALAAAFSARAVISGIADFDAAMSRVQAITRASSGDLARMRDIAIQLGASTEFSAAQAADGLQFLGMAGFSAAESMAAIPQVLDLATAAGMGLAQAADTASNIMSAFGIQATNAANVTDVLAAASTRANTNVAQLGQAISTAGPIAATLGIALEDTAAAIGVMSDAGIQGERAGTALRGVMAALAGPTTQAQDALARYGLTAADVDPATRSLADIMETLGSRGLSTADAMMIFGREAASGALVMVQGSARLREFGAELRNVNGAASEMAATMRDNLRGDLQGLSSAISSVIIALGDAGLTDALRATVQAMTAAARFVADNLDPIFRAVGVTIAALAATQIPALVTALAAKTAGMTAASIAAGVLSGALRVLAGAVALAGGPLGLVLGILGGLTAAMVLFRDTSDTVAPIMDSAKDAIDRINSVLATSSEVALPAAARATLNLTNENIRLAQSAYAAAEAQVALAQAGLQYAQNELNLQSAFSPTGVHVQAMADLDAATARFTRTQSDLIIAQRSLNSRINEGQLALTSAGEAMAENQRRAIELSVSMTDLGDVLGGAGGGGGAGGDATGLLSRFEALRDELRSQTEQVELWYSEAQQALQWALENERITLQEHADLRLEIERLYQANLREIRNQEQAAQLGDAANFFGSMAEVAQQGGERMTRVARAFGAAQALINTYLAASQTLADPTLGFFAKLAAVAKVVASGLGFVNAIRGGGKSGGGGSPSVSGVSQPQTPLRRTVIELRGDDWVRNIITPVMEQIYEATRDGERVVFA